MKNSKRIVSLLFFILIAFTANAQFTTLPSVVPPANTDPTVKEIFKKIEDTEIEN